MFQNWDIAPVLQRYKPLLHYTESIKRNDIVIFCLYVADERNC